MKRSLLAIVWVLSSAVTAEQATAPSTDERALLDAVAAESAALETLESEEPAEPEAWPNDPLYGSSGSWRQDFADQWAVQSLEVYQDADTTEYQPVVVAVIDTGLDYLHEDFATAKLWHNPNERRNGRDDDDNGFVDDLIGWNFVDANNNPWDQSGHGTHVAGIISACTHNGLGIAAINPAARIMPLKVGNFVGQARSSAIAAAIYYAVDHGARVINLSLGGAIVTMLEEEALAYAEQRNVLVVTAAGNDGHRADASGYSAIPSVLSVAASDLQGARAGFSNFGAEVDLVAPGVDVLSLRARDSDFIWLSGAAAYESGAAVVDEQYYRASGTSFAAAVVSGVASRVLSVKPDLSASQLKVVLLQSARDVEVPGVDQLSGFGLVDFNAALMTDPEKFIEARLRNIDLKLVDEQVLVLLEGTADANRLAGYELQVRAEQPEATWLPLASPTTTPIRDATLLEVNLETLIEQTGGATQWRVRLLVNHQDGSTREAQMALALPQPEPSVEEETEEPNDE
ncbi:MAG: S8 family serine peptidase [Gammaproteobacteria bacterium]|nr:S8 family serine peptidase [Gammaproteobacteria bacterium]